MDQIPYYFRRKNEIDKLRRQDSSTLKKRTLDILASDLEISGLLAKDFPENLPQEDNSTFEERFNDYLRSIDQDEPKECDKRTRQETETDCSEEKNQKKKDT